eukprot:SAG22_NODE_1017_length_6016_cov_40.662667_6_plen_90_part_00
METSRSNAPRARRALAHRRAKVADKAEYGYLQAVRAAHDAEEAREVSHKALHLPCVSTAVFPPKTVPFHAVLHNTQQAERDRKELEQVS